MKYLKEYLSHNNDFTDEEYHDILDMFQDLIDEYTLIELERRNYTSLTYMLSELKKQHSYAITVYNEIIVVFINYDSNSIIEKNKFLKDVSDFQKRLIHIGYSIGKTGLNSDYGLESSFNIRKNLSFNENSIGKYRIGHVPRHEFDLDILKDVFNEMRDNFDIELSYNQTTALDNDYPDIFCWCNIKCHEEDNNDIKQDVEESIYRTLEHYYRETGKELTAYIAMGNYEGFYGNYIVHLLICFVLKINSSNMVTFSSFSAKNKIYQRRNINPSGGLLESIENKNFSGSDIENIMDVFRDLRDEYDIDHIDFDINTAMRLSYNLFYRDGSIFNIIDNIEDEFTTPQIITNEYCIRLIFPFDSSAFVYPYEREKELLADVNNFVKRLNLMGYNSNSRVVRCDEDNSIDGNIHVEYIDIGIKK